jgi:hypothetical protein
MIYLLIYLVSVGIFLFGTHCYNRERRIAGKPDSFDWSGWWPKAMVFMPGLNTALLVLLAVFYIMMTIYYFGR